MARGTTTFAPWRQGAVLFGIPAAAYPLSVGIAAFFDERVAAQLRDPGSIGTFISVLYLIATTWLLLTCGGHFAWRLRQEAVNARHVGRYRLERRLGSGDVFLHVFELRTEARMFFEDFADVDHRHSTARGGGHLTDRLRRLARLRHRLRHLGAGAGNLCPSRSGDTCQCQKSRQCGASQRNFHVQHSLLLDKGHP